MKAYLGFESLDFRLLLIKKESKAGVGWPLPAKEMDRETGCRSGLLLSAPSGFMSLHLRFPDITEKLQQWGRGGYWFSHHGL